MKYFASDNYSGAHPTVLAALQKANDGFMPAYGDDQVSAEATALLQEAFGSDARPHFVFSGTAANVLGLKSVLRTHECVLCADTAHIATDECGAVEANTGSKVVTVAAKSGKLTPELLEPQLVHKSDVHRTRPRIVSITQLTELATRYSVEEIRALSDWCHYNDMYLHMDGARLANASAGEGCSLRTFTADAGVDVLSFGGTKNGLLFGEAVVFFHPALGHDFPYVQKQHMQLCSKMRFVAAQFKAYLTEELWRKNAAHANAMAALLAEEINGLPHVHMVHGVTGNGIFARMPKESIAHLNQSFYFYTIDPFDAPGYPKGWPLVRLMTSFCTAREDVLEFAAAIRACCHVSV